MQRQWLMESAERSAAPGLDVRLQTACRAIGVMNGLDTSFNVLMAFPAYREIMQVPVAERAALMRDPARRARLLAETPLRHSSDAGGFVMISVRLPRARFHSQIA